MLIKKITFIFLAITLISICVSYIYKNFVETKKNFHSINRLDSAFAREIITILSKSFNARFNIKSVTQLSEPERRNLILRIVLENIPQGFPESVILKQSVAANDSEEDKEIASRFARDWAGLEFLNNLKAETQLAPRFYGGSKQYRFVLIEDLGEKHVSLVDSLTMDDQNAAISALERFMKSLGQFHAAGYKHTDEYLEILQLLNPEAESWQEDLKSKLNTMLPKIESILKEIEISFSKALQEEIITIITIAMKPGIFTTYVHGDICPDNTFDNPRKNQLMIIDFEAGQVRSALSDGTYLRMSMPTCWCAKAIPKELIESLEAIYRQELIKKIPAAKDDELYHTEYVNACAYWMLKTVMMIQFIWKHDHILQTGPVPDKSLWKPEENLARPRILSRLQAFIDVSKKYEKLTNLRSMAEQILKKLKIIWPDAKPLDLFPAFKGYKKN